MRRTGITFNVFGAAAWILAAYLILSGYDRETTVLTPFANGFPVANAQQMHFQMVEFLLGCCGIVTGTLFFGFSAVISCLSREPR